MKRPLYIYPAQKTFMIDEFAWWKLDILKVFFPPEHKVKLGSRWVKLQDISTQPTPEQMKLLEVPKETKKLPKKIDN